MIFKNAFFATMIFATLMKPIGEELPANTIADMEFVKNFTHPDFQAKSLHRKSATVFSRTNSVNASNINNLGIFWL